MASEHRHLTPRIFSIQDRAISEITHNLRIGAHRGVSVEVGLAKRAKEESFGLEREHRGQIYVLPRGVLSNALVQLQAQYHHCGEAASEKCLVSCNVR